MKKLLLLAAIFLAGSAEAQVIGRCYTLMSSTGATATGNGSGVPVTAAGEAFIAYATVTENSGTSTLDIALEHAPTCSGTFTALKEVGGDQIAFAQFSATDAMATAKGKAVMFPCVRAARTITGTGNWDVTVKLCLMP